VFSHIRGIEHIDDFPNVVFMGIFVHGIHVRRKQRVLLNVVHIGIVQDQIKLLVTEVSSVSRKIRQVDVLASNIVGGLLGERLAVDLSAKPSLLLKMLFKGFCFGLGSTRFMSGRFKNNNVLLGNLWISLRMKKRCRYGPCKEGHK
jgi:hypothetical protein